MSPVSYTHLAKRSVIGYQVSDNRGVGPCILAMRMAFQHLKELPKNFKFLADGYRAYALAAQQFLHEFGGKSKFEITQAVSYTHLPPAPTCKWWLHGCGTVSRWKRYGRKAGQNNTCLLYSSRCV